jgi:hypothetical protein
MKSVNNRFESAVNKHNVQRVMRVMKERLSIDIYSLSKERLHYFHLERK